MDSVTSLETILRRETAAYATTSPNAIMHFIADPVQHTYAVISVPNRDKNKSRVVVMARLQLDQIVIETDITDKPLYDALVAVGVPEEQIVRAYLHQPTP